MRKKVLVVDDELAIRQMLGAALGDAGYRVVSCDDGRQAVEVVAAERPDLVLLDQMLPGIDGTDVIRETRRRAALRGIPIVLMSAAPVAPRGADRPNAFLAKPFDLDQLLRLVERLTR